MNGILYIIYTYTHMQKKKREWVRTGGTIHTITQRRTYKIRTHNSKKENDVPNGPHRISRFGMVLTHTQKHKRRFQRNRPFLVSSFTPGGCNG